MRRGFTLVELFVVMAILAVLIGTMSLSVSRAQQRARIATAQTTVREITHAILSYQNYDDEGSLANYLMEEQPANEGKLGFILGRVKAAAWTCRSSITRRSSMARSAIRGDVRIV